MTDYMTIKVREGLDRIARERPSLDFSVTSPALTAAELRLNELMYGYTRSPGVTESDVRAAFREWERALIGAQPSGQKALGFNG